MILIKTQKNDMYFCMRKLNKLYVLAKQNCTCPLLCIKSSTNDTDKTKKKKNCFRMMPSLNVLCRLHLCLKFNTQKHIAATKRIQCYEKCACRKKKRNLHSEYMYTLYMHAKRQAKLRKISYQSIVQL